MSNEHWYDLLGTLSTTAMNMRTFAAIHLRVPNSGNEALDDMIRASLSRGQGTNPEPTPRQPAASKAAQDVLAERQRQISQEGWTPEHDDTHVDGELAQAAACYALPPEVMRWLNLNDITLWPFSPDWWKPSDERQNLIKAGALILAEIERLDRADAKKGGA